MGCSAGQGSRTYPWRAFQRKYFSNTILVAWDWGPGIRAAALRGGSILSARIITPLLPASRTQIAWMSPNDLCAVGSLPRMRAAMFLAAVCAWTSVGKPVLGTPTGTAVVHGTATAAAMPTAQMSVYAFD